MISATLSMWGQGAVTLPKKWREQFKTKHFLAEEDEKGNLVIQPIEQIMYYEHQDGSFGLRFPMGIEAEKLGKMLRTAQKKVKGQERKSSKKIPSTRR